MNLSTSIALVVLSGVLFFSTGCPNVEWEEKTDFAVEVGYGWGETFTPYENGGTIRMEQGIQGGHHIAVSLRTREIDAPYPATTKIWLVGDDGKNLIEPWEDGTGFGYAEGADPGDPEALMVIEGLQIYVDNPDKLNFAGAQLRAQVAQMDQKVGRAWIDGFIQLAESR